MQHIFKMRPGAPEGGADRLRVFKTRPPLAAPGVDVIAPPYKTAAPLVSGLAQPFHLTLNHRETDLFVTSFDFRVPEIWVFDYLSGNLKTTLGSGNGLPAPLGVAESPSAPFPP